MKKNMSLSKLAELCGCSPATVSYVLNGRKDQRISEETEQKILQMANLYQYRINPYAKALATGELHNIMFFYDHTDFSLAKSDILNFINDLSTYLKENKYNVIVAPVNHVQKFSFVDAIITYRISRKKFFELANKNFVPVISIDTIINDNLFYEVVNNFDNLRKGEQIVYLSTSYQDEEINNILRNKANVIFINSFLDLHKAIQENKNKHLICLNNEIKNYLDSVNVYSDYYCLNTKEKLIAILKAINDSISRNEENNHQIRV